MSLINFLNSYSVKKGSKHTHTSLTGMSGGLWFINNKDINKFFKLYSEELKTTELHITEKHMPHHSPIAIDFDFQFLEKTKPRPINNDIIVDIVQTFTKILQKMFGPSENFTCIVLQRPTMCKKKEIWADGLHIHFPYIVTEYINQFALRNKFIKEYKLNIDCLSDLNAIYDKGVIESINWCMYGSTKRNIKPYEIVKIFNSNLKKKDLTQLEWIKLLSIRNKSDKVICPIKNDFINEYIVSDIKHENELIIKSTDYVKFEIDGDQNYDVQVIKHLLNLLSPERADSYISWINIGMILHYCSMTNTDKQINFLEIWKNWSQQSPKYEERVCDKYWSYFGNIKKKPLSLGSLFYYAKKDNPVGFVKFKIHKYVSTYNHIFNLEKFRIRKVVNNGNMYIIELNIKKCPFTDQNIDNNLYFELRDGLCLKCPHCPYKMLPEKGSLKLSKHVLKSVFDIDIDSNETKIMIQNYYQNDPQQKDMEIVAEFEIFDDKILNTFLYEGLNFAPHDFAVVLHYLYKNKFNCTQKFKWYVFQTHLWRQNDAEIYLILSYQIASLYKEMKRFYNERLDMCSDKVESAKLYERIEKIHSIIRRLKDTSFKENVVSEAKKLFYAINPNFEKLLNTNLHLIGFDNGVYDLEKFEFRDGKPDDYVTLSVGYDYTFKSKYLREVMSMLNNIITNKNILTYLLKALASCLTGFIKSQKVFLLIGDGSNGKSLLMSLVNATLGDYCSKVPVSLITQKRTAAEQASPQIHKVVNSRLALFSEPNKKDILNSGLIKELSGGEQVSSRGLHQDPVDYIPQYKIFILCNYLPKIDDQGKGIWRRIRSIPFTSNFVENPDPSDKTQFKLDEHISDNFDLWKFTFVNILIEHLKLFNKDGLYDIPEIMESTDSYKKDSDYFQEFIDDHINHTNFNDDHIEWNHLKQIFDKWYSANYHKDSPNAKDIKHYFTTNIFKVPIKQFRTNDSRISGWRNFKLINIDKFSRNLFD
jgi:P4 family phage/plasmid primase-like protien